MKNSKSPSSGQSVGLALSFLWFGHCTFLVIKQNELLIATFYSLIGSFLVAMLLSRDDAKLILSVLKAQKNRKYLELSPTQQSKNTRTKAIVGIAAFMISLAMLVSDQANTFLPMNNLKRDFHALCLVAGYLVFGLWWDRMCVRKDSPQLLSIAEDASTLSILAILLTMWGQWDISLLSGKHAKATSLIVTWHIYKIVRYANQIIHESRFLSLTSIDEMVRIKTNEQQLDTDASLPLEKQDLWMIHGTDYDLTDFVARHPGGKESILLGRGRDCTALFESYHPFTNRHRDVLQKYKAVETSKETPKKSMNVGTDEFYEILKQRVMKTLKEHRIDPVEDRAATNRRTLYYLVIVSLMLLSALYHVRGNVIGSSFFAVFGWLVGAIGHDAGHFSVSRIALINDVCVWGIGFLCNPIMWQHQHTYAHHSYTNDFHHDPDLHHFSVFLRVHRKFQKQDIYRNQTSVFYVFFAYAFVVFGECIKIPLEMMKTGWLYNIVQFTDQSRPFRAFLMYLHYVGYISLVIISPFFYGKSHAASFTCVLVHVVLVGWLFAIFSQINHLNEFSIEVHNGKTSNKEMLEKSWAARQVATSNNFATSSLFWHIFSNGLNMQIEHHLFPGLNHCHLHLIQPTVQKTCEEYGVHYKSFESWSDVMSATLQWMGKLSA